MDDRTAELLTVAAERAISYLRHLDNRPVAPSQQARHALDQLGGPLPAQGEDAASVIRLLDEYGSPATMANAGRRFFGFVVGGAIPATVAAHWLADAWDQNACLYDLSPVAARLEEIVLDWLLDLLRLPRDSGGAFVTGAQMANFTALAAARHAVLKRVGWNVEEDGLFGAPPITVVVGEEVHVTLLKALSMLGLGRKRIVTVVTDTQGRVRADLIPNISGPTIVCTQVGNVNTGACDPVGEICDAVGHNAWVHVDGAFGLWAAAAPSKQHLVLGVEAADSWATDAHKWLNVPQDSGIAFVRDGRHLRDAMAITARYLSPQEERREPMQYGPESSRRARAVEIWAALRNLGRLGVAGLVERTCLHAQRFAEGLRAAGFEILNDVVLNQVLVSFGEPEATNRVIRNLQTEGTCWCGGTVFKGRSAMRISVSSWATRDVDVERSLDAIIRAASPKYRKTIE